MSVSHQPQTSKLHNGQIPAEILDLIHEQLPVLEQICFALTCRYHYTHFVSFLKVKDQNHAKLLIPREKRPPIYPNTQLAQRPRIQLLQQLQNESWKSCVVCMNLHPRSAFEPSTNSNKASHRYKRGVLSGPDCMPYAGLVDICPCLSISFRERALVVAMLLSMGDSKSLFPKSFTRYPTEQSILHQCKVTSHLDAQVTIETELYMGVSSKEYESPNSLHVRNTYTFDFPGGLRGGETGNNEWLKQFFIDAGLDYSAWRGWVNANMTAPHLLEVVTVRNLGCESWNKRGWKVHRNDHR